MKLHRESKQGEIEGKRGGGTKRGPVLVVAWDADEGVGAAFAHELDVVDHLSFLHQHVSLPFLPSLSGERGDERRGKEIYLRHSLNITRTMFPINRHNIIPKLSNNLRDRRT